MKGPNREISGGRKTAYYIGTGLIVAGFLTFFSIFLSQASAFGDFTNFEAQTQSMVTRAVLGIGLIILGAVLMNVGSRGLAGSGVVLDPQRTRQDLEPWTRAAGGMLGDALDESGVKLDRDGEGNELPFDEKLRRLEALRKDELVTEAEYQAKRGEIVGGRW